MKITLLKFRIALLCAVFVLFITVFSNRMVLAKNQTYYFDDLNKINNSANFVRTTNLSGISKSVFQTINFKRKQKRLKPLFWEKDLASIAYDYSKQMAREGFFSHYDLDGNTVVERAKKYKIKNWLKIGENLFQCEGYRNPSDIAVKGWLKSRSHRENIYDPEWTHTGIGTYTTRSGEVFITQVFLKK